MVDDNGAASEGDVSATPTELNEAQKAQVAEMVAGESKKWETHFQSIADRDIGVAQRKEAGIRAQLNAANEARTAIGGKLRESDPALAESMDNAELRAQNQAYQRAELDNQQAQVTSEIKRKWEGILTNFIDGAGLKANDPRIDWGTNLDPIDFLGIQERVMTSVNKITKEENEGAIGKLRQEFDDKHTQNRKDLGLDSPDTTTPPGAAGVRKVTRAELKKMPVAEYQALTKEGKLQIVA